MTMDKYDAHFSALQNQMQNLTQIAMNTLAFTQKIPETMDAVADRAASRAVKEHEAACQARSGFPGVTKDIGEITGVIDVHEQRRRWAKESVFVPSKKEDFWIPALKKAFPWIVAAILSVLSAVIGKSFSSNTVTAQPVDNPKPTAMSVSGE